MARPIRTFWVNNVTGSDTNMGTSEAFPFATIDKAIGNVAYRGGPGDTIKIAYTGTYYEYDAGRSTIGEGEHLRSRGVGWNDGEYIKMEGYDPDGGNKRPGLTVPKSPTNGYALTVVYNSSYWYFSDLFFLYDGTNTGWASSGVLFSTNMSDEISYFKFRRCMFDGSFLDNPIQHSSPMYFSGGSRVHVDVQHCLIKNSYYWFRTWSTLPNCHGGRFKYNLIYGEDRLGTGGFYFADGTATNTPLDFTFTNNTVIGHGTKYGSIILTYSGLIDTINRDKFEIRNNFVFNAEWFVREYGGITGLASDITDYVGYNTFGRMNSTGYVGAWVVLATEGGGEAKGDHNIQAYSQKDGEDLFKDVDATTYFWPESGWMTIPDFRPVGWEMTGTWEDPIDGLRGAIQYSGIYNDASIDTAHECMIAPAIQSAWFNSPYWQSQILSKGTDATLFTLKALDRDTIVCENWGDQTSYDLYAKEINTAGTKISFSAYSNVVIHPSDVTCAFYGIQEGRAQGPGLDMTRTGTLPDRDGDGLTFSVGILGSGSYQMDQRIYNIVSDTYSDWELVVSWVVP